MAQNNKVVSLSGQTEINRFSMPAALVRLRDTSSHSLRIVLSEFFDRADDALFNMAEKAMENSDQVAYFDAMRELRLRRKSMTVSILQLVSRAFNELGNYDPIPGSSSLGAIDQDSLTLMAHSELEQKVAIDSLITKLRAHYVESIQLLETRVSHVMTGRQLKARQMPLSPEVICIALAESCADLDIDIRAKLIVIKLFDKLLISNLQEFYLDANRLLAKEGVLPDMVRPPQTGAHARQPVPAPTAPPETNTPGDVTAEGSESVTTGHVQATFSELSALLHNKKNLVEAQSEYSSLTQLNTASLMATLGKIQSHTLHPSKESGDAGAIVSLSEQLRPVLEAQGEQRYRFQQIDRDVINLVSMLFDFILEDTQLPPLMKGVISRLQVPMLKVALTDQNFFNRGGHPARKLLNDLAMAGIGWNEKGASHRDPLKNKIESVVDRLLGEYTDDPQLFSEVLEEFSQFMDLDRRRRELVEQRLRDVEEGRALQERASKLVDSLLVDMTAQRDIPGPVNTLLDEPWSKYLQWVVLREGESSELWQKSSDLTRRLIWTVDPHPIDKHTRSQLLRNIPAVVDEVREALNSVSWDPFAIDKSIRDLELAHVDVFQKLVTHAAPPDPQPELGVHHQPGSARGADVLSLVVEVVKAEVQEVQETPQLSEVPIPAEEWLQKADALPVGSWVEMLVGESKMRCKLAALIKATGKYIFVNRNGAKIAEYHRNTLALALAEREITILDDGLIFDRALESIIDNLRNSRRDTF